MAIVLLCIALWVPSFITGNVDAAWRSSVTPLYNLVADILDFWPPAMLVFAMLLMGFEAMFFNSVMASNQIINRTNTLGAVIFLLLMNLLPVQTTFYPFLLASVFVLMFIHTVFAIYQSPRPELYLLNAGFFVAFASMCWFPSLLLAVWGVIALSIVRKGSFRLHVIPFIGLLLPYFFYFAYHFLKGDMMLVLQSYADYFQGFQLSVQGFNWLKIGVVGFLLLVSTMPWFMSLNYSFEKSIAVRTRITITIILLLFGIFMLFVEGDPMLSGLCFVALSILFSYELAYIDRLKWPSVTFILLLLAVLASHYVPFFI